MTVGREFLKTNYKEAAQWYRLAAQQGHPEAQFNLGALYLNGQGVSHDDRESAHWFKLAAEQGQAEAEYNLGVLYANGQGVSRDDAEAVRWYRLAAERDHRDAQFNLAVLYASGRGTARDLVQAEKWFQNAARAGDRDADAAHQRLAARMSAREMEQSKALAAAWTPCKTKPECDAISDADSGTRSSAPKSPR